MTLEQVGKESFAENWVKHLKNFEMMYKFQQGRTDI